MKNLILLVLFLVSFPAWGYDTVCFIPFDEHSETDQNYYDYSGHDPNHKGVCSDFTANVASTNSKCWWAFNSGVKLDGTDACYVDVNYFNELITDKSTFAVSFWLYRDANDTCAVSVYLNNLNSAGGSTFLFQRTANAYFEFSIGGDYFISTFGSSPPNTLCPIGTWNFYVLNYKVGDRDSTGIWINSVNRSKIYNYDSGSLSSSQTYLRVSYTNASYKTTASIYDNLRVHPAALSQDDINTIYALGCPSDPCVPLIGPPTYHLYVTSSLGGSATGEGDYEAGTLVDVVATADADYHFTEWDGADAGDLNSTTSDHAVFTMPAHTSYIKANFASSLPNKFDLTMEVNGLGTVIPASGVHQYTQGEQVILTAYPATCEQFNGWSGVGDIFLSSTTDNPTIYTVPDENDAITANFLPKEIATVGNYYGSFNGVTDYLDTNNTFEDVFNDSFTVNVWIKTDGLTEIQNYIWGLDYQVGTMTCNLNLGSDGKFNFSYGTAPNYLVIISDAVLPPPFSWSMVTLTVTNIDGSHAKADLYLNSVLVGTTGSVESDMSAYTAPYSIYIGADHLTVPSFPFKGFIDQFEIRNKALDQNDVNFLYNGGLGIEANLADVNLVYYCDFNAFTATCVGGFKVIEGAKEINNLLIVGDVQFLPGGVVFPDISHTLTYDVNGHGSISPAENATQYVDDGANGKYVNAIPDWGYHFTDWNDGDTSSLRRELNVKADLNFTANFEPNGSAVLSWYKQIDTDATVLLGTFSFPAPYTINLTAAAQIDDANFAYWTIESGTTTIDQSVYVADVNFTVYTDSVVISHYQNESSYGRLRRLLRLEKLSSR